MTYIFFWRQTEVPFGVFSQWSMQNFTVNEIVYSCTEQYMMAEKARLFGDTDTEAEIMSATKPNDFKRLGRKVKNFDQTTWEKSAFNIVVEGNIAKFQQNPELLAILLATGNSILVEASPYDKIWGIGMKSSDKRATTPTQWLGDNLLGQALMKVRDRLT
jgi:ribA/ribD-fused uncharacterized protein